MLRDRDHHSLSYLITVSKAHVVPARMLITGLKRVTQKEIVVVGNLDKKEAKAIKKMGVTYIDEDDIDFSGRLPQVQWASKYRAFGWYKQMFIRLCIDRFMKTEQVVILDSEVFVFDNWDEARLYDPMTGQPRMFYWIPTRRKPEWDYRMYQGAAYLFSFLPEATDVMKYAGSTDFKRHISGVVLFSTENVRHLWSLLEQRTDLQKNIDTLFNKREDLAFSDHDFYGIAVDLGIFNEKVRTVLYDGLNGWYDNHDDVQFESFKDDAMWSMCQSYAKYKTPEAYYGFMKRAAKITGKTLVEADYLSPGRSSLASGLFGLKRKAS